MMVLLEGYSVEQTKKVTESNFEELVRDLVDEAKENLIRNNQLEAHVMVLRDDFLYVLNNVPNGVNEFFNYLKSAANHFKGADAYFILLDSWVVPTGLPKSDDIQASIDEAMQTPFKDEIISFKSRGFNQKFEGRINYHRDDKGDVVIEDVKFETTNSPWDSLYDVLDTMFEAPEWSN